MRPERFLFRCLLLLYPSSFRRRFGDPMTAEFEATRKAQHGAWEVTRFWSRIVLDAAGTSARAWWHALTEPPCPTNPLITEIEP